MNKLQRALTISIFVALTTLSAAVSAADQPYRCESNRLEVIFDQNSRVRLRDETPVDLTSKALTGVDDILNQFAWVRWQRFCDLPEERFDQLQTNGEARTGKPVFNLNNIYRLVIPDGHDIWEIAQQLEALPGIILARPMPLPTSLPFPPPDYVPDSQAYLRPAVYTPTGIDADYAWTLPGGDGLGVTVCDLEYGWNFNHVDVSRLFGSQINPNPIAFPPGETDDHGTAACGILVSDDNGWGTKGICHGAGLLTCGTFFGSTPGWDVPNALGYAIAALSPGDVILLEQQWDYSSGSLIPIEWWLDYYPNPQSPNGVYLAIQNAVANGIHVIEAGGNGNINTDGITWYGNSGAIIVGAGGALTGLNQDLQRLSFSSYGSRFDLQGWGEHVVTTGYGDLYLTDGKDYWYTNTYSGTSSASPVVAGAVACCVGYWKGLGWPATSLTPSLLKSILIQTGTPQNYSVTGHIGPRPNLRAACSLLVMQEIEWTDVTTPPLANNNSHALGVAWGDYDGDGDDDLYFANNGPNILLRNDGGGVFTDVTTSPLDDAGVSYGIAWGDYDNDGDLDLYLSNNGSANKLFRNDGGGTFAAITTGPLGDTGYGTGCSWADYDQDGDIDLYVANWQSADLLLRNDGGSNFTNVAASPLGDAGKGMAAAWADFDNDGDLDFYLVKGSPEPNRLYENLGGGSFADITPPLLANTDEGVAAVWGDFTSAAWLDIYLVNNGQANKLFQNMGGGTWIDGTNGVLGDTSYNFGAAAGDCDNDGDLDIYLTTSYCCNHLFDCVLAPTLTFADRTTGGLSDPHQFSTGTAMGDYDLDGSLDIVVATSGSWGDNKLFRNKRITGHHWVHFKLVGTSSNRSGIGARVELYTAMNPVLPQIREISAGSGFCSQNSLTAEFGLGLLNTIDSVVVRWPSGKVQAVASPTVDMLHVLTEPSGGGCCVMRGDVNHDGGPIIDIADLVWLVDYMFSGGPTPPCWDEGDIDGSAVPPIDITDLVYLVDYMFTGGPTPPPCL